VVRVGDRQAAFNSALAERAKESGFSQRTLAASASMSRSRLNGILRGDGTPATVGEAHALAEVFGLRLSDLVASAEKANPISEDAP